MQHVLKYLLSCNWTLYCGSNKARRNGVLFRTNIVRNVLLKGVDAVRAAEIDCLSIAIGNICRPIGHLYTFSSSNLNKLPPLQSQGKALHLMKEMPHCEIRKCPKRLQGCIWLSFLVFTTTGMR